MSVLNQPYLALKSAAAIDLKSDATSQALIQLVTTSLEFLEQECDVIELESLVAGKEYFSYAARSKIDAISRPINLQHFIPDAKLVRQRWMEFTLGQIESENLASLLYTMATAYSAASDLFDRNNKKGPATYFENLVGYLFSNLFKVNPSKRVRLPIGATSVLMTMDFLFDLGEGSPKVHLPVKISTRERVVQAWAHQRLLDSAFEHTNYRGILIVHSETKLAVKEKQVVEICVPDQWLAYQTYLATMDRIYYFDLPSRYKSLTEKHPEIQIKNISEFFHEIEQVLNDASIN